MKIRINKYQLIIDWILLYVFFKYPIGIYIGDNFHRFFRLTIYGLFFYMWFARKGYLRVSQKIRIPFYFLLIFVLGQGFLFGDVQRYLIGIRVYITPMLVFAISIMCYERVNLKRIKYYFIGYGVINALVSILEFFTKISFINPGESLEHSLNNGVLTRTLGLNGSYFVCAMILGVCLIITFYELSTRKRIFLGIAFGIILFGLLATQSRGPLVGTIIAIVYIYFSGTKVNKHINSKTIIKAFSVCLAFVLVYYIIVKSEFTFGNSTLDTFLLRLRQIFDWTNETANVERMSLWNRSLEWFGNKPIFGYGIGSTGSDIASMGVTESGLLLKLVELGVLGCSIYLWFQVSPISYFIRIRKKYRLNDNCKLFVSIILLILVEDIILQICGSIEAMSIYWMVNGFLVGECNKVKSISR